MSRLVVIGLGYVGLPLAKLALAKGHRVVGLDRSDRIVTGLNAGRSHVDDISDDEVATMVGGGFVATTDPAVIADADVVVICVPTPLSDTGGPDLRAVTSAGGDIADHLTSGLLVVLESTTYPGTTEEVLLPILESRSELRVGADFALAFSPERVDPGNKRFTIENTPKVVGGVTDACTERARAFYASMIDEVVTARGTREAEMAKLLENTYRHVNIALVNEMVRFSKDLGIDFWNVIELAATKPFGFQPFYPGPGVGGHCIPIDPNYLSHRVKQQLGYPFRFVELAQEINSSMPSYVIDRIRSLLNDQRRSVNGTSILLLGITYKPDIADQRETPAEPIAQELIALGAEVSYFDPHVTDWQVSGATRVDDPYQSAADADLTLLVQPHSSFDLEALTKAARHVFDLRGLLIGDNVTRL